MLFVGLVNGRPDSQLSFGIQHGALSRGFIRSLVAEGFAPDDNETGLVLTYQDKLAPFLSTQPDVRYIRRAYSQGRRRDILVVGLRLIAGFVED